jgi:hypothetical protein
MRWNWDRRFVRQVLATLIQARRRDLIHDFLVLAMSLDTAKQLLGFDETDAPSTQEVEKAWKRKALEHHPDRGGSDEMMKQINIAHDVLTGKQRPDGGGDSGSRPAPGGGPVHYQPPPRTERVITWDEAARKANVPTSGVDWKFVTATGFGGYGDRSTSGFVLYGQSSSEHVFVGVASLRVSPNMATNTSVDETYMWVMRADLKKPLAEVGPKVIRTIWKNFDRGVKAYNNKVMLLEPDTKFQASLRHMGTRLRKIPFKTALEQLGETSAPAGAPKGKIDIVLELGHESPKTRDYEATLVVNGRPYKLSDASQELLSRARFYRAVWGKGYYYADSKKNLTRIKSAKKVLTFLAERLKGEPPALMDALKAAAERAR